jgi:hypothetical protein
MGSGMTNFLFFVRDERDIGFETTWQLRQNSGASVIRYLKMIGKSCLGGRKLNVRFTLWSMRKDKLDF